MRMDLTAPYVTYGETNTINAPHMEEKQTVHTLQKHFLIQSLHK